MPQSTQQLHQSGKAPHSRNPRLTKDSGTVVALPDALISFIFCRRASASYRHDGSVSELWPPVLGYWSRFGRTQILSTTPKCRIRHTRTPDTTKPFNQGQFYTPTASLHSAKHSSTLHKAECRRHTTSTLQEEECRSVSKSLKNLHQTASTLQEEECRISRHATPYPKQSVELADVQRPTPDRV